MQTDGRAALLAVLATLVAITVATNTTASLAQPQIGAAFDAGPADTAWVVFGYSATFALGTALWGGIAARTGIIPALVAGVSLLGVGSAAAAVAPSLELVIGSRLVQGLGSGAIPTLATALIAGRFDGADRARALGVIIAAVGGGQALGPLLGGVLLEVGGWRPAVSIGAVAIPAVIVLARSQRGRASTVGERRIDWTGAFLVGTVALGLTFVLNRGPLGVTPTIVAIGAVALVAVLATLRRAATHADAFVPADVLANPVFRQVVPLGALGLSAYIGTIVLVPILGARAYGLDGIALGLLLLPMAVAAAVSSPNNARVQARLGPRTTTRLALALLGGAPIFMALAAVPGGPAVLGLGLAALGAGFGILNAPLLARLTHAIGGPRQPVAVGVYNLCFFLGGAIGASVSSAIVQAGVDLPLVGSAGLPGFTTALLLVGAGPLLAALLVPPLRAVGSAGYPRTVMPTPSRPDAVIFDLDGTLVDTVPARIHAWDAVFAEAGIPATRAQLAPLIGIDGRRLAADVATAAGTPLDDDGTERIDARAGELFDEANRDPRPLPGAAGVLRRLDGAGITWAIATSSRPEQMTASLASLDLAREPMIIDGKRVERAKPAPDLLLLAAQELSVSPGRTWYVGDSTWDMRAAVAAGMTAVGVLAGAAVDADELRRSGATIVIETLDDLPLAD
ncbi:MAG TPA: MFS transporter [Candidatus Angelobacter sp.]|nr:MFS transporter [Candidatus Angelobacter sp.]